MTLKKANGDMFKNYQIKKYGYEIAKKELVINILNQRMN